METVWKAIPGYDGQYEVSDTGAVRSTNYRRTGNTKELKPIPSGKGYLMVGLCKNGKMHWEKIHRLVASLFIPNPENKPQVNHLDGVKTNNVVSNLEWATGGENQTHAYRTGLKKADPEWGRTLGKVHGNAGRMANRKPIIATDVRTGVETRYESAAEIERVLGVYHSDVARVCAGKRKHAKGHTFRYVKQEE